MIKIGIVGLGFMAVTHIKAYRNVGGVRIGALCSPSGKHLDGDFSDVAGNIGSNEPIRLDMLHIKPYRIFNDMIADPAIDMIDICAPTAAHSELAIAALRAGKHVLCEKPLARTSKDAKAIAEAAKSAKGYFMPAMCLRFWPEWAWLKQVIDKGDYGRVLAARFRRVAEPPGWGQKNYMNGAQSGGALFDLHIHDTDFVQFCFGRPKSVFSTGYSKMSNAIDHVLTQYQVASGAIVSAEGSWAMTKGFGFNMAYTVNFERATIDYDMSRGENALRVVEEGQEPRIVKCEGLDGYVGELIYFAKCIENQTPPQMVTAADGVSSVEICEAEEESVKKGLAVNLA
ncbi:Gfo/Idh/MocA family protein [Pedosphaera parvula]|uniref:Oxidoreductase domain protein n=1 Tax=Pedosphaera parvula (strain Ellin514) TaxID=320771 RepID=B9XN13_PEDPL|nr:Gfo/Idh/MocA family oxidoreductase [Pedosphaera parvula]EEF58809.1 oxidoreductase domain protein [Pedosphaera parvula Ellin514]